MIATATSPVLKDTVPSQQQATSVEHVLSPSSERETKRVIVLPVDSSEASSSCCKWVLEKFDLSKDNDEIVLLNCRPYPFHELAISSPYLSGDMYTELEEGAKQRAHTLLKDLAKGFLAKGFHVRAIALVGETRPALEEKIKKLNPSIVILSNRGLGVVGRMFLGSVSTHILHHSESPVMIVPFTKS